MVSLKNIRVLAALLLSITCAGMSGVMAMDHPDMFVRYDDSGACVVLVK